MEKKHTLPSALEEEAHNKHLQRSHRDHHQRLNDTEVEDPALGAAHGTEVTVLTRAEVLLVTRDRRQLRGQFVDGFFEVGSLLGAGTLTRRKLGALLILNLCECQYAGSFCNS
jgi:hypothetical protein